MKKDISPSEALYGFMGWLTVADYFTDCSFAAQLVDKYCKTQGFEEPREGWSDNLISMKAEKIDRD